MKNEIKCKKPLRCYDYLLMFDLASKNTGVSLWDLKEKRPIEVFQITTSDNEVTHVYELYEKIEKLLYCICVKYSTDFSKILISKEAMPVQLRTRASTVQTFVALARSHATLDLFAEIHWIAVYDYVGIYPVSWQAYFKRINGLDSKHLVSKEEVQKYLVDKYGLEFKTLDESDATFLGETFLNSKWNKDIDEEIRAIKREKKELKAPHAIALRDQRIEFLEKIKI